MLEYLQKLFAPYRDGLCEIRCLPSLKPENLFQPSARFFGRSHLAKAAGYARAMRDTHDVYVGVLPRALARSSGGGRDRDIQEAAWLWADIDAPGASADALGSFLQEMRARLPAPQMCVVSGSGGAHLYWRLSAPESLTTAEARQKFAHVLRQLAQTIGGTSDGIHADPSARNPSRILRVPGTLNHKHDPPAFVQGIVCEPTDTKTLPEWKVFLPYPPQPPAKRRDQIAYLSVRGARLGGRDTDPVSPGLRAWADKGYPEGQRHTRLAGDAAWLRRSTDLPEQLALELFRAKARASPGKHPLTEAELDRIWRWA